MDSKWLEKRLDKQDEKLDKITQHIAEINVTLGINTESLKTHIKRTDLLESQLNSLPSRALIYISILSGVLAVASKL